MGRKEDEPLEKKKVNLYQGDWDRLSEILAARKISPTFFIRRLVRRTLLSIQARSLEVAQNVETDDDVVRSALADSESIEPSEAGLS